MKKVKVTQREIKEGFKNIIEVGYCEIQHLLSHKNPDYYTSGVYGWNADIYKINNNTVIVTGYRPFGNIRNWNLARKYEEKAYKIDHDWNAAYESRTKKLDNLLRKYIEEILKEKEG